MQESLSRISARILESLPGQVKIWTDINESFKSIDAASDSALLIEKLKTGSEIPADLKISDTSEELKDKIGLKIIAGDKSNAPSIEEQIMKQDPKKARKQAVERVKALEKEIAEVERQRQIVDLLCQSPAESVVTV
jgi:hypothetical protein